MKRFCLLFANFNPRSRTGSDGVQVRHGHIDAHFNPRSRTGSDIIPIVQQWEDELFQPTLPHGERRIRHMQHQTGARAISTHAPARGATRADGGQHSAAANFNPRSRTGSDVAQPTR